MACQIERVLYKPEVYPLPLELFFSLIDFTSSHNGAPQDKAHPEKVR